MKQKYFLQFCRNALAYYNAGVAVVNSEAAGLALVDTRGRNVSSCFVRLNQGDQIVKEIVKKSPNMRSKLVHSFYSGKK
jgi:hypothetical protein